ncbi:MULTISPECIES: hypothetical protein [Prauserella salsuginis group]|uniref:Uncharacterized protein n=2 Tax=Prauserella salsuginis group TaxID=2893672 RepID=A0A839XL66_9PSEU|nr:MULTISPECIES: hypothetical protein [Prauserella salsuginis group]MBB3662579.1 hypothetical protein [Prauserella sediminis]
MKQLRWSVVATGLYVLWGVLHVGLGVSMLAGAGLLAPAAEAAAESAMFFACAVVLGCQAIAVAITMNRTNSRRGYWLNLLVLGAVDAIFIPVMVVPGHVDPLGGLSGPLVWLAAAAASTVALLREPITR